MIPHDPRMIPVVTPTEMRRLDATCEVDGPALIERAARAVAGAARSMLGGVYGRRVIVLAGPGNNGADGRGAARILRRWGVHVTTIEVTRDTPPPSTIGPADLIIDAVLGTGSVRPYQAPLLIGPTSVLAVDIPSGVDAATGAVPDGSRILAADVTITFVAPKPGLLVGRGASLCGIVRVVDLGLSSPILDEVRIHMIDEAAARRRMPIRRVDAHKWTNAVLVVAGSAGMTGAAILCARSAGRAGARMVRLAIPGSLHSGDEIVGVPLPAVNWAADAAQWAQRCGAVVIGPGLGRSPETVAQVQTLLVAPELQTVPVVVDADGLAALTPDLLRYRKGLTLLTPHDGEFVRLTGRPIGPDRIDAVRSFAVENDAVMLLKGQTTVVGCPDGSIELIRAGDQRLATAGSGDVLSGILAALLCQGVAIGDAAASGAVVHGGAALRGRRVGLLAGDLPELVADLLSEWENSRLR